MLSWQKSDKIDAWLNRYARFIVAGIMLVFIVVSLVLSYQDSLIMDEQAHIPAAYSYVTQGDMRLNPEHPPLIKDLAGSPLLLLQPKFPSSDYSWTNGVNEQWKLGQTFLFASGNNPDAITFWSRLPIILLALLLAWFIFRWTSELAGTGAGLGALLLYVCDPNIIAHSHYVTTDIGIAALVFIATYYFIRWLKKPTLGNVIVAGMVLGLAQLTKFSAVLLWPLYAVMTLIYAASTNASVQYQYTAWQSCWRRSLTYFGKYIGIVVISGLVIWTIYAVNTWNMPTEKIRELAANSLAHTGISQTASRIITAFSSVTILKPLSEYILGVFMVHDRVKSGSTVYFLGNVYTGGSHAYFPIVFLIKETIPFLILLLGAILITCQSAFKNIRQRTRTWWELLRGSISKYIAQYTMSAFVILYTYFSIKENLNIGFRHLFPILPFLYVLIACAIADLVRQLAGKVLAFNRKIIVTLLLSVFAVWIVAIPVFAYPNYLSYFNEVVGGHHQGYKYVTDSNYDWGQDLKRLQTWVKEYNACAAETSPTTCLSAKLKMSPGALARIDAPQPITSLYVDYFGGDNPRYRLGDMVVDSHSSDIPMAGWHAISVEYYQESAHQAQQSGEQSYHWLTTIPAVGRAGDSILLFYITPDDLALTTNS